MVLIFAKSLFAPKARWSRMPFAGNLRTCVQDLWRGPGHEAHPAGRRAGSWGSFSSSDRPAGCVDKMAIGRGIILHRNRLAYPNGG